MLTSGWRSGVAINAILVFMILLMALLGLSVALSSTLSPTSSRDSGDSVVFAGACRQADQIGWGLSAAVNVFAVIIVAGANYVCQVLGSPTRRELDKAHAWGRWMDLGIPSVRNLVGIAGWRVAAVGFIMLMALSTQVM